ncbi:PAS domain-containing protein [uncultured Sphingomonas sp.]|uniref:PAS domain-containing protein n=1 Tax=uncultured Sphingomonas sp. TaxID=158754 RepID=UPI0025CEAB8D|nr:PAS domain-containing protein [uncultured Sphingomonas sp.]
MEAVTASDLVRHFGAWRDRAMNQPVYIHHHGRPKLVLTSVDFLERLVSSRGQDKPDRGGLATLLDMMDSIVLVTDADLCLVGISPPARHLLVRVDWRGKTLEEILPEEVRPFLLRAVEAARASGVPERLQLRLGTNGSRRVDVSIEPYDDGVCVVGHDRTAQEIQTMAQARMQAIDDMVSLLGNVAWLRINLRGYIVGASKSFERLSGLMPAAYSSVRLPTLFDLPTRVGVGDTLEKAIDTMSAHAINARLIAQRGEAMPVQIAFSGELLRVAGDVVLATLSIVPSSAGDAG